MVWRSVTGLFALGLVASTISCRENSSNNGMTPLPRAYARVSVYDSAYRRVPDAPICFEANSSASAIYNSVKGWLNVSYPAYGGTLYITVSPASPDTDRLSAALADRYERMMLNLGDNEAEQIEVTSPQLGAVTTILTSGGAVLTPVQFVSACGDRVVSGAFSFSRLPSSADSVAPLVSAVRRDVLHAAKNLK